MPLFAIFTMVAMEKLINIDGRGGVFDEIGVMYFSVPDTRRIHRRGATFETLLTYCVESQSKWVEDEMERYHMNNN